MSAGTPGEAEVRDHKGKRVAVIGGGPGGAQCARRLAEAGVDVTVFEPRVRFEKACGGGIPARGLERYPFLIDAGLAGKEIRECLVVAPSGREARFSLGHPLYVFSRGTLHSFMLSRAATAGARVVQARVVSFRNAGPGADGARGAWDVRAVAPEDGPHERPSERERRLEDIGDPERREGMDGAPRTVVRGAQRQREVAARRDADTHEYAGRLAARVAGHSAFPRVEGAASQLDQALRHEDRMALAEVDRAPADLRPDSSPEEEGVRVGPLHGLVGVRTVRGDQSAPNGEVVGGRSPFANRKLRSEGERRVAIGLDHDQHRRRDVDDVMRARPGHIAELLDGRGELDVYSGARPDVRQEALDRVARRVDDVVEGHSPVVRGDEGLAPRAVHAETCRRAKPLDAQLPRLVVEADGGLRSLAARHVDEGECEIAQDEGAVRFAHPCGHVRAVDEDVEQLACGQAARTLDGRRRVGGGGLPRSIGRGSRRKRGDDDLEAHSVGRARGGRAKGLLRAGEIES